MAHYHIFQISTQPICKDAYITPDDYYEECYDEFRDYMDDELTEKQQLDAIAANDVIFSHFFERDGRSLTFTGADNFIKNWIDEVQDAAAKLTLSGNLSFWDLKKVAEQSHCRDWNRFVWTTPDNWTNDYPDTLGDFALTLFKSCKPGDQLYLGGVVSFHF